LTLALEDLGFTTLHTQHLYENDEIFEMWTSNVFQPSIEAGKALMGKPDLDLIASFGFQATMDLPMALYFEQVHERYPDCKFILTTRENSTVWFRSWDVLSNSITQPAKVGSYFFTNVNRIFLYLRWLFSVVNNDPKYLTAPFPLPAQSEEASIASYEAHNARVRATIDPHLLLEYNVEQGWAPLCQFLEVKHCPKSPFPRTNSARSVQSQAFASTVAPFVIVLVVACLLCTFVLQRLPRITFRGSFRSKYDAVLPNVAYNNIRSPNEKVGKCA
jgi:Sulfotransferase domain